jgi:transposase
LRGWLRTVIWHALVDLFRQREAEVPLDQCAELNDVGAVPSARTSVPAAEELMLESIVRERYGAATLAALDQSLAQLEPHETLLLMYYHVDGLKLREIARIIESPTSPMRRWFKRSSSTGSKRRSERVHESTVMRWLEKAYRKVSQAFCAELQNKHGLKSAEIEICMAIATEDLGHTVQIKAPSPSDMSTTVTDAESNR